MIPTATVHCTRIMRDRLGDDGRAGDRRIFAYPAAYWRTRSWHLGIFLADTSEGRCVIALGLVHPGKRVGDYERGLNVDAVSTVDPPLPINALQQALKKYSDSLTTDGPLTDARGTRLRDAIVQVRPELRPALSHLAERLTSTVPGVRGELLAWQKDATGVLLEIAGMERDILREWLPPQPQLEGTSEPPSTPFLVGLPQEDLMLAHDHGHFLDWEPRDGREVGVRYFVNGNQRLWVYVSNRRSSETELGMDLIYYHENHDSFALVQYKRMIKEGDELVYRPDSHISHQLEAMRTIDHECLSRSGGAIRLVSTPSLVKLCEATEIQSDSANLIKGMYLTREHFENLLETCKGPRGGSLLTYKNVPRYLNNTMFTGLLRDGWLGSANAGSGYVKKRIEELESSDRSLVVGVQRSVR